jgi:hypothetical protein
MRRPSRDSAASLSLQSKANRAVATARPARSSSGRSTITRSLAVAFGAAGAERVWRSWSP